MKSRLWTCAIIFSRRSLEFALPRVRTFECRAYPHHTSLSESIRSFNTTGHFWQLLLSMIYFSVSMINPLLISSESRQCNSRNLNVDRRQAATFISDEIDIPPSDPPTVDGITKRAIGYKSARQCPRTKGKIAGRRHRRFFSRLILERFRADGNSRRRS